jgi:fermentation-respiration switch protein FrsA (DUF1100 family)
MRLHSFPVLALFLTAGMTLFVTSCAFFNSSAAPAPTLIPPAVLVTRSATLPPPAQTATPEPTSTPSIVTSPSETLTPTEQFTATPTLHPMSILALRQATYPGSEIGIVEELDRGVNYRRFYASYLSEGLTIFGLLTIPDGEKPASGWPAIVFNHGYIPPEQYRTTERYISYVDWLARSGYVVFRIDYRGNDRSDGEARSAYGDPGYTIDVLNAVASLKRFPEVDPGRIGMWGHSMGGFLTLRAMVISNDIRAGVIWAGVVGSYQDLLTQWHARVPTRDAFSPVAGRGWRSAWSVLYGSPEDNPDFWGSISANTYLSDLSGPIQLHHGTDDHSVPIGLSETLAQQIKEAGKTVELYTYEGDNHNLSNDFSAAMTRTIKFFNRYLKNIE